MIALALFFLLFLVITGATMSAYGNSVKMGQKARAEDIMSTAVTRIERDLESWSPTRTESYTQALGDIEFRVEEESRQLPDDTLEVDVRVSWSYKGRQGELARNFVRSLEENP